MGVFYYSAVKLQYKALRLRHSLQEESLQSTVSSGLLL